MASKAFFHKVCVVHYAQNDKGDSCAKAVFAARQAAGGLRQGQQRRRRDGWLSGLLVRRTGCPRSRPAVPVYPGIWDEGILLDVLQKQVPVDLTGRFLSASRPFPGKLSAFAINHLDNFTQS